MKVYAALEGDCSLAEIFSCRNDNSSAPSESALSAAVLNSFAGITAGEINRVVFCGDGRPLDCLNNR